MAKVTTEFDIELAKWQAKITQIKADMKSTKAAAKSTDLGGAMFGGLKGMLPALGAGAAAAGIKTMLGQMDDLADISIKLGETPEVLQRVDRAAQLLASVNVDGVANSMLKLERALGDVDNAAGREALARYGVTAEQLMSLPLDQKILVLSDAFKQARDSGSGLADLQSLMGRSAAELIPMLEASREEITGLFDATRVVGNEAVFAMAALNDEFDLLIGNAQTAGKEALVLGSNLAGALMAAIQVGAAKGDEFLDWLSGGNAVVKRVLDPLGMLGGVGDKDAIDKAAQARFEAAEATEKKIKEFDDRRAARAKAIGQQGEAAAAASKQAEEDKAFEADWKVKEKAQAEARSREENIARMQKQLEEGRIELLPDDQKLGEYERKLKEAQERAGSSANFGDEEGRLKAELEALEMQRKIAALGNEDQKAVKSASTPGGVAGALNILFGRSANELILDESKQQTAAVKENTRVLNRIEKLLADPNKRGQVMGAFPEVFGP
jgi:hypothetical protein